MKLYFTPASADNLSNPDCFYVSGKEPDQVPRKTTIDAADETGEKNALRRLLKDVLAINLFAACVFVSASLLTYNRADIVFSQWPQSETILNACGILGAYIGFGVLFNFGLAGYVIPFLLLVFGHQVMFRGRVTKVWLRIIGGLSLMVLMAALLSVVGLDLGSKHALPSDGGLIGSFIGARLLTILSPFAAMLILSSTGLAVLVFTTGMELIEITAMFLAIVVTIFEKLAALISGKRGTAPKPPVVREQTAPADDKNNVPDREKERMCQEAEARQRELEEQFRQEAARKSEEDEKRRTAAEKIQPRTENEPPHVKSTSDMPLDEGEIPEIKPFRLPDVATLEKKKKPKKSDDDVSVIAGKAAQIESTLKQFNIDVSVVNIERGPTISQFELELAPGIKTNKILAYTDDIARALKAVSVRVNAPIPGRSTIGVEVPNVQKDEVNLRELIESDEYRNNADKYTLPLFLGKDLTGKPLISDLTRMPHLLIAGSTGSGKSVCVNSIILSILMTRTPDEARFIMIDPKIVELSDFRDIPHLACPVVTEAKKASAVLDWAVRKMEIRYRAMAACGVRHISDYNALDDKTRMKKLAAAKDSLPEYGVEFRMPHLVVIADEFADLMMVASKDVETSVTRLAQKSRAVGIHVILATQRPSVDVITGLIKTNIATRIAFKTASKVDSRTILDSNGAEALLGMGDMLFVPPRVHSLVRAQGTFVTDKEIKAVVKAVKNERAVEYFEELSSRNLEDMDNSDEDEMYWEAVRIVVEHQRGSVSLLQRKLGLGYNRASRLIELMEEGGVVGPNVGSQAREVFLKPEDLDSMLPAAS